MKIEEERIITNLLLLDYFDMWDEFDIKSLNDTKEARYYNLISILIDDQIDAGIRWIDSPQAEEYFKGESAYQKEVFQALEDEWDTILESKYNSVESLLDEVYRRGKAKGYSDMREHVKFTEQDKLALEFVRDYNFGLIQRLNDDTIHQIKNTIIQGFIEGKHPYSIVPEILKVAENRLDGSTFTPKQRAVMIARTEVSRVQNTGILQSYVNEGYTEVKILTAEDNNVCDLCLRYAFEFNKDEPIIYENHREERTHNIIKLINGGQFPPFHPNCRCTYLSVWESKGKPPEDPFIVNLTPLKFLDPDHEINLPDGKPKIRWTKESLKEQLSNFTDSEKELNKIVEAVMDYMNNIENRNKEFLSAMNNDFKMVCTQYPGDSRGVSLCPKGKKSAKNGGLLFVIHNHPSNNPLQSEGDIKGFAEYNVKYNIVFTERRGLLILKNNNSDDLNIITAWNNIFDKMKSRFIEVHPDIYKEEERKLLLGVSSRTKFKNNIKSEVKSYMSNNIEESLGIYYDCMVDSNIGMVLISP